MIEASYWPILQLMSATTQLCEIQPGSTVLVTGATGFTGAYLVKKLVARGLNVRAIARDKAKLGELSGLPVAWIFGNVFDEKIIQEATTDVNYIFHLAAAYREAGISDETYYNVHVRSTQLLAQAALRQPDFKRFIHTSTVGVHGHIDNPPADETCRFMPGDIYQQTKAEAETWLHDFAKTNKLPYTVIRPAAIYGPGDKRLLKIFKMVRAPVFPILGYGKCLYHLIHVEDLTDAMLLAATHPKALGEAFIIGNPEPNSLAEIAAIIASAMQKPLRILRIPAFPFFAVASLCELICKPLGIAPPIYKRRVAFFTKDRAFNTRKMRELLDFRPSYTAQQGLSETTKWYLDNNWINNCNRSVK